MKRKIVAYCRAQYEEDTQKLRIEVSGGVNPAAQYPIMDRSVSSEEMEDIRKEIVSYWEYVDQNIQKGTVDDGTDRDRKIFFDDLKTRGGVISRKLFSDEERNDLWMHAAQSDMFLIWTNLHWIPWEALYNPDSGEGEFLSDNCVISRIPTKTNVDNLEKAPEPEGRIVCVDPVLDSDFERIEKKKVSEIFKGMGEEVYFTDLVSDLTSAVSNKRIISWICEHETTKGLRLCSDVHFSLDDCFNHRFPAGSLLFIISCAGGRSVNGDVGMSASIVESSDCTVVSPSSIIAARAGVDFAKRLVNLVQREECEYLHELWAVLKRPFAGEMNKPDQITAERCYALWFSIFGNCEVKLGAVK
ncbi:hypothetical protein [Sedimentitalea sp.]|uniref:hypothetical protein n=1 Tax=Sedimentitalea sp. TaxID=2048915 RepID=UPI003299AF82